MVQNINKFFYFTLNQEIFKLLFESYLNPVASIHDQESIKKIILKTIIFSRMTPILKKNAIKILKSDKNIVAMCGGLILNKYF